MENTAEAATGAAHDSPKRSEFLSLFPTSHFFWLDAVRHDRAEVIPQRLAVVTGGNKGIGLEVCRQLALQGVTVNNAAISGIVADEEGLKALNIDAETWTSGRAANLLKEVFQNTYDEAFNCLNTNYYGCKRVTEALLPLLKQSTSGARIVNCSSLASELKRMPNEKLRNDLCNINIWDEDRIEAVLKTFLEDLKNGRLEEAGWPMMLPTYSVSKMVINLYTRIMARRYPEMRINCVRPGFVKTDLCWNLGVLTPEQGARGPVMLALLPDDGPTGCYFDQTEMVKVW
nr:unnamed protein product [Digitaria exilis]